jgi:predicted 3-demethylubiquinone-9 3-methyltransferase (glyoxalase superfamily)
MSRRQVIEKALEVISQLPDEKVSEVVDFASFVLKRHEETTLQKGIEQLIETSSAFSFLHSEEDLYTLDDLKERYK